MAFKTEQEEFWAGDFGKDYIRRNQGPNLLASNIALFSKALRLARGIDDCIEFGANIGMNLAALQTLFPKQRQYAVEINTEAAAELANVIPKQNIVQSSLFNFVSKRTYDLVLIKGVLIHINPDFLPQAYAVLHANTRRYLLLCEYHNLNPIEVTYRGHANRLFKRDFCGEILDRYPDLKLLDYGFVYHRDPNFPLDDNTWFLLEKESVSSGG